MFCPQCGNPIAQAAGSLTTTSTAANHRDNAPLETAPAASVHKVHDDGVRGRVEKLRKVSSVVIDQAAYDPSLRFLLVAAVLFLLFLVLLILSKVLG